MRYLSVCSGMEAASVAWHPLGWTPVGFSEIEPFPCAILKHRFPNVPNYGSLTEYQSWPIEQGAIDLLVGGTPCQSFSVAGLRKGLADPRGNLALTFLALADRLKPKWIVWENVPGVLSSGGGRDFGSFLGALVELGYGFAYRVLDAQHFGVPQRRRRVFVVACLGDWRAPAEVLSLREGLRGYLEAGGKKRKGVAADAGSGAPASIPVVIDRAAFNQGVNAQYEPHIEETEVMDSLVAPGPHAVGQPIAIQGTIIGRSENAGPQGTGATEGGPMFTLTKTDIHGVAAPIPFRKSKRAQSTTDNETWVPADVTNTLNNFDLGDTRTTHAVVNSVATSQDQWVAAPTYPINTLTLGGRPDPVNDRRMTMGVGADGDPQFTLQAAHSHAVATPMAVRRLTPVECERLQGFPDNWSRISWKGKPETECPDGPRYKACGNSMAVPVMAFIGRRIAAVESSSHA